MEVLLVFVREPPGNHTLAVALSEIQRDSGSISMAWSMERFRDYLEPIFHEMVAF